MPRGDGTGPMGQGPMTGRAAGYCSGFSVPGFMNPTPRMGMGFRRGAGFSTPRFAPPVARTGIGFGRGAGFGRGRGGGRGFGNFGRGRGFRARVTPFAPVTYQTPVYTNPGYGNLSRYPAYQARPVYGTW
ncbi:MAG: DUF5320 domain-containing protein [Candidatus Hadarchaeia archaeon]